MSSRVMFKYTGEIRTDTFNFTLQLSTGGGGGVICPDCSQSNKMRKFLDLFVLLLLNLILI